MTGLAPIPYDDAGVALRGELALPDGAGPHPGILVCHGGMGFNEEPRDHIRKLAARGYAAFAADLFAGNGEALTPEEAGGRMMALREDPARLRARLVASLAVLAAQPGVDADRIAVIGFCFGGWCALELARTGAALTAVISIHGLLTTTQPAANGAIRGQVAVFTGTRDPLVPADDVAALRREMTGAGASWQVMEYGDGWHGFTDASGPPRYEWIRYDPLLDRITWASALALLDATMKEGGPAAMGAFGQPQVH